MIQRYQVVIFDWEGTLADSLGPILMAIREAAKARNLAPFDEVLARQNVHVGIRLLLKKLYPSFSEDEYPYLLNEVERKLASARMAIHVFPGAIELISTLSQAGVGLAIATNKDSVSLQRDLQVTKLGTWFKVTRCANQTMSKPHPQMLEEILDCFQVSPAQALMIGDSESDMLMAKSLNVDAIGIDPSDKQGASLTQAGAQKIFRTFDQIAAWIANHPEGEKT
ncbi:MAG: HAD family hydrolase [Gammaproteobacteria bacterium]|nr:HAD family hydrolase [Gammaproteobacteria bacterium]